MWRREGLRSGLGRTGRRGLPGLVAVGLVGLTSALAAQGCDSDRGRSVDESEVERGLGDLSLGLILPDGSEVQSVTYAITRNGQEIRSGTMQIGSDGKASATLTGLEAGSGYRVVLTAPRDGGAQCAGESTFTVVASQTSVVHVLLQCDDLSSLDAVTINGQFNICPKVTSTAVSPVTFDVGQSSTVSASASDRDGDALTYAWSAASGTFAATTAATTSYTCASAGAQTLTVAVTDARGCTRSGTTTVTCVAVTLDGGTAAGADAGTDAGADAGGTFSSSSPYLVPVAPGVVTKAILTAGDSPNLKPDGSPYRMVGLPDGLGAFDNGDGTFTLLSNHELGNTAGTARAHGGIGAFVSRWKIRKSDLAVLHGEDLIRQVQLWSPSASAYALGSNVAFGRFCSADLAPISAWYNGGVGFDGRLFLNGEETGAEGRGMAHGLDGTSYELPRLGKFSWENSVAHPSAGNKTIVVGLDDTTPGQVYVYVGTKGNSGSPVDKAGLTNGTLYAVAVTGATAENASTGIPDGPFALASLGNVENSTGAQLDTASTAAGATAFNRPEDGAWDPSHPNDFYFVTTASFTGNSRLWRLRFTDVHQPELGGQIATMLDGSEGHKMLDNIGIDGRGHLLALEDVGAQDHIGRVFRYDIATDTLTVLAQHDPNRFAPMAPDFLTRDEEASGVIDASALLGNGWYLLDVQAHYAISGELVEGGQYLALYDPGSL